MLDFSRLPEVNSQSLEGAMLKHSIEARDQWVKLILLVDRLRTLEQDPNATPEEILETQCEIAWTKRAQEEASEAWQCYLKPLSDQSFMPDHFLHESQLATLDQ